MLKKFMTMVILGISFLSMECFGSNVLLYGVIAKTPTSEVTWQFRKNEINAIETALSKPVKIKQFSSYRDELSAIQKNPNELSFLYAKQVIVPEISKINNWKKVAQVLSVDSGAHRFSTTYTAFLITAKNSKISKLGDLSNKTLVYYNIESASNYIAIKKLLTDSKVTNVHWIKVKNISQAYAMVESEQADAVGTWDYYFNSNKHKNNFKVIHAINNLNNPVLYANTNKLSPADIKKVRIALQQIGSKTHPKFTYN